MKKKLKELVQMVKQTPAPMRGWAGGTLAVLLPFAIVGMVLTIDLWGPLALLAALVALGVWAYRQYQKKVPPQRVALLREVAVKAVCYSLSGPLPYDIDRPTRDELLVRARVSRENGGADLVSVPLLLLERDTGQTDLRLLHRVFADRLVTYSHAPGLGLTPCSRDCPLLALAGVEMLEGEITLRVLVTDRVPLSPTGGNCRRKGKNSVRQRLCPRRPPNLMTLTWRNYYDFLDMEYGEASPRPAPKSYQ